MTTVVGVRFREVGKIYYFDPGELELKAGDNVIVDTARGTEFGTVMVGSHRVEDEEIVQPLKVVRRRATADDVERVKANREKERNAFAICKEKVRERGLEMKLISAEYTFDNAKILFYFTADGRVDFRELVKDLAAVFRIRIELRQVGVRDETKLMGGLGGCGRPLCCASYLSDFVPVSIRMAKEQNLSLNPQKISGVCGRLMCCLKNEADTYEDLNTRLPKDGGKVITPDGREGIAETVNVLRERVRVLFTDAQGNREMEEFAAADLQFTPRRKPRPCECRSAKPVEEAFDYDASELVAEADSETDPALRALARAEAEDVLEERDTDEADANVMGEKKRRRRRRRKKPDTGSAPGMGSDSGENGGSYQNSDPENLRRENRSNERNWSDSQAAGRNSFDRNRADRAGVSNTDMTCTDRDGSVSGDANRNPSEEAQGEKRHRRHHRRNQKSGEGGGGSIAAGVSIQKHNDPVKPQQHQQPQSQQSQSGGEGTEKKQNGAYRRFRKRRSKNPAES